MQVMLMRLMSKIEYLIAPKGTKFTGSGKLGLRLEAHVKFANFKLEIIFLSIGLWPEF